MEYINSEARHTVIDIESDGGSCEEETGNNTDSDRKRGNKLLSKLASGVLGYSRSVEGDCSTNANDNSGKFANEQQENIVLFMDKKPDGAQSEEHAPLVEKKHVKDTRKTTNSKKASKPPRPPKGPSLEPSDFKLVKEISELTMKKRARIERMKALKKAKASKTTSSSYSSLSAMVVTVIFCLVLIFQGLSSKNSSTVAFEGSPEPAVASKDLISIQVHHDLVKNDGIGLSSEPPISVEQSPSPNSSVGESEVVGDSGNMEPANMRKIVVR